MRPALHSLMGEGTVDCWNVMIVNTYPPWNSRIALYLPARAPRDRIEAESCPRIPSGAIVTDEQADDRRGEKAVWLQPGGPGLTTEVSVATGIYQVFVIARDPAGKTGLNLVGLEVTEQAGHRPAPFLDHDRHLPGKLFRTRPDLFPPPTPAANTR